MNPLQSRLAALRRRLRLFLTVRGACWLTAVALAGALVGGLLDWAVQLPALVRAIVLDVTLVGVVYTALRYLVGPLTARADDLTLALKVEEHYPELNDALASTVQFLQQTKESEIHDSTSLRREAVQRALRVAQGCDFNKVVNPRGSRVAAGAMGVTVAAALTCVLLAPLMSFTALLRLLDPFGDHDWPRQTQIVLDYPSLVGVGQPMVIRAELKGKIPEDALFEFDGHSPTSRRVPVKVIDPATGNLSVALDMTRQRTSFKFRVKANDATSPKRERAWHEVKVLPPPRLDLLDGKPSPQVELFFRPYTDLPSPLTLPPGKGDVEAFAGTRVRLRAATDKPVTQAWIEYKPTHPHVRTVLALAPLGAAHPVQVAALTLGGRQAWDVVPGKIDASGKVLTVDFLPWIKGDYALHFRDAQGLGNSSVYRLDVLPDPPPLVTLKQPSSSQPVTADAEITLQVTVEDDFFAVRRAYLEYRRKDAYGNFLDREPGRLPLFDHAQMGAALPRLMGGLAAMPLSMPVGSLRMRPKALEIERRWSIRGLVQEGQTLVIQACADDFNDVLTHPEPGRSTAVELHIVPREVIAASLASKQKDIFDDLKKLRDRQEDALKKLLEVKEKWEGKGKLTPEDRKNLEQVVESQKDLQNKVGTTNDEGMRFLLEKLKQMIQDNHMPSSGDKDRINAIANEINRLGDDPLPKILDELKNLPPQKKAPAEPKKDQPGEKFSGQLDKAAANQQEVAKSLDELLKHLDQWAGTHEIKGETKALLDAQKDVLNQTKEIAGKPMTPEENKAARDKAEPQQRRLADRAQTLLNKVGRLSFDRTESDPESAKKLKDLFDFAEKNGLVANMRETSDEQLRKGRINQAIQQQQENVDTLKKMVKKLEEDREEELDRLLKKQDELQKDLKQLADRMDKLQKRAREAGKNPDAKARERELKKLADEQKKLQEETQKKVRELARLQAPEAARALGEAAQKMERAARQLDRGDDPADAQKDALDRLEEAREELDDARKDTQEELAREQLVRIADQIKGLKERQDAAVDESVDFHRRLMRAQDWENGLGRSLGQSQAAQSDLAKETEELLKKLEAAPVFAHILGKAAKAMEKAVEVMEARRANGEKRSRERKALESKRRVNLPAVPPKFRSMKDFNEQRKQNELLRRTPPQLVPFLPEDVDAENKSDQRTQQLQKEASRRLGRLLDALKNDKGGLVQRKKPKEDDGDKQGGKKNGEQKAGGKGGNGDGIPQIAELKALRAEQAEINDRTKEIAQQHPDLNNLPNDTRAELQTLQSDQQRVHELFQKVTAAEPKGGNP